VDVTVRILPRPICLATFSPAKNEGAADSNRGDVCAGCAALDKQVDGVSLKQDLGDMRNAASLPDLLS